MVSGVGNRCMMSHWIQYIILYYYIRLKPSHQLGKLPGIRRSRGEAAPCICNLAADFGELWVGNGSENGDGNHAMALLMGKMMINSASQYIFQPWQKTMIDAHPNSRLLSFASLYNRKLWGNWAKQQPATGGLVPRMVYFISSVYCLYFIHERTCTMPPCTWFPVTIKFSPFFHCLAKARAHHPGSADGRRLPWIHLW